MDMRMFHQIYTLFVKVIALGFLGFFVANVQAGNLVRKVDMQATASTKSDTRGLLYEIKSGDNVAYLFGSIHIAKADFYPMSPKVEAAYLQADTVAVEADTSDPASAQAFMPKLMYTAPDKLEKHLTPATWANFKTLFGPGAEQMQSLKPFMITSMIAIQMGMQMGFDPLQGIDLHFINRSKKDKKSLVELESLDFQANIVGSLNDEESDALISSLIESMKKREMMQEFQHIVDSWNAADAEAIAKIFVTSANKDPASKRMMKMLMDDRNEGMVAKINDMMKAGKKLFVVVGAGHLAGEKSVVDLLKKQGLDVKQIR
jgi:uncharacterized protein YbaP (TraB family)